MHMPTENTLSFRGLPDFCIVIGRIIIFFIDSLIPGKSGYMSI